MSTKWQRSCIEALCTSPVHYQLFKVKQSNKRMLKQFESRLFPFYIQKEEKKQWGSNNAFCKWLKETIQPNIMHYNATGRELDMCIPTELRPTITKTQFLKVFPTMDAITAFQEGTACKMGNNFAYFTTAYGYTLDLRRTDTIEEALLNHFARSGVVAVTLTGLYVFDSADYAQEKLDHLVKLFSLLLPSPKTKNKQSKKLQQRITRMNVGIEIEYEGQPFQIEYEEKMKQLNAVEFISGQDGLEGWDTRDSSCFSRLRENRLRIDGLPGTKALYQLVQDMVERGDVIPDTGSIHMHIDCKWDNLAYKQSVFDKFRERRAKFMQDTKDVQIFQAVLKTMFDCCIINMLENIRMQDYFQTLEYRFASPLLNYKTIMLEMIVFSHITKCVKTNSKPNLPLLELIADIHSNGKYFAEKSCQGSQGIIPVAEEYQVIEETTWNYTIQL